MERFGWLGRFGFQRSRREPPTAAAVVAGPLERAQAARIAELEAAVREREGLLLEREAATRDREALLVEREAEITALQGQLAAPSRRVIPLGRDALLVELEFGGWIVVPAWNIDVAIGIVRDGIIEPWTHGAVRALLKPGQTFINVGVNLGYYVVLGAHCVERSGQVIGIEANRRLFPYLMRTIGWAGFPETIRLFNCAASDADGMPLEIRFDPQTIGGTSVVEAIRHPDIADRDHSWSITLDSDSIEDAVWERADLSPMFDPITCELRKGYGLFLRGQTETKRLDTLFPVLSDVNLMLMDIEGSEAAAILGSREIIRRSPELNVILEWSPFFALRADNLDTTEAMYAFLSGLGYRFFRIRHEGYVRGSGPPALVPLPDKAALYGTPHNDVLVSKDPDRFVEGWSTRFVDN